MRKNCPYITPKPIRRHKDTFVRVVICTFQTMTTGKAARIKSLRIENTAKVNKQDLVETDTRQLTTLRNNDVHHPVRTNTLTVRIRVPVSMCRSALNQNQHDKWYMRDDQEANQGIKSGPQLGLLECG